MLGNLELISRLVLAAALGSVIGFERERLSWAAGLRTHRLVCVGSALIMIVSAYGLPKCSQASMSCWIPRGWRLRLFRASAFSAQVRSCFPATIIFLIILAGIKPLERRFITVKQRRQVTMLVERGTMTFHCCMTSLAQ
jgi:putative Mg2+ transporter-C (MgtC) family protein